MFNEPNLEYLHSATTEEFLPPLGAWTTIGGVVLLGTFVAAFALASVTQYKIVVKAPATVRPSGEIRLVQAPTEGTIQSILVKENQIVKQGDVIAHINDSQLQTKKSQLQGNIQQNQLQLAQIDAQIDALDRQMASETERSKRAIVSAKADMNRTQRDYQDRKVTANSDVQEAEANIKMAEDELQKAQADLKSAQANVRATDAAFKTAIVKRDRYKSIAVSGSISQNQLEEAQLAAAQQEQALESQKAALESQKQLIERQQQAVTAAIARKNRTLAALNPTNALVTIATEKIAEERATSEVSLARLKQEQKSLLQRKIDIQNQINSVTKDIKQLEKELQNTVIRAVETGTILKLELRNSGQVVRPGEPIAQIAPSNVALVVKARISAMDISKIKICKAEKIAACQQGKVQMRVSAYPYPDYGTLKGAVREITADAITPQNNNSNTPVAPYYELTIEPETINLQKGNQSYPIQPGMEITADIISQEETVLTFILRKARLLTDL
jgi:multidrug efflux pump subunit AcrA (membrane-fusion protein)